MLGLRRSYAVATALVVLLILLAGCDAPVTTRKDHSPNHGNTVTVALYEEPDTLLPFLTNETHSIIVHHALWAPLWYGDHQAVLHSGIADLPTPQHGYISHDLNSRTI